MILSLGHWKDRGSQKRSVKVDGDKSDGKMTTDGGTQKVRNVAGDRAIFKYRWKLVAIPLKTSISKLKKKKTKTETKRHV